MNDPLLTVGTRQTPQSQPIPGSTQVRNNAGGYAWQVDDWTRLRQFLVLGVAGGTFYVGEQELALDNVEALRRALAADGRRFVDTVVAISEAGDAPKQEPTLFAHAMAASVGDADTRSYALATLDRVARTGTMLFQWNGYAETMRGWGRARRKAISRWYERPVPQVAYQAIKYRSRDGWSHRDLLRLAHPKTEDPDRKALFEFIVKGDVPFTRIPVVDAYLEVKGGEAPNAQVVRIVREQGLPWEVLPDKYLDSAEVWDALLDSIGLTALLRNLPKLTRLGVIKQTGMLDDRLSILANEDALRKARIHPVAVLNALRTYAAGASIRGTSTWTPVAKLVDLLDDAYTISFRTITPAGKRTLLGLDVSGSMAARETYNYTTGRREPILPYLPGLSPRDASAAMAMATLRTEPDVATIGFTAGGTSAGVTPLPLTGRQRLDDVIARISHLPYGATDCALPMLWALHNKVEVDCFAIFTDAETRYGDIHPAQALTRYREQTGIDAKLVVVGMTSAGFSIADPQDRGSLDVVGFDASAPKVIADFSRGDI